jgi:hypothetical protein
MLGFNGVSSGPFTILTNIDQYGVRLVRQLFAELVDGYLVDARPRLVDDIEEAR